MTTTCPTRTPDHRRAEAGYVIQLGPNQFDGYKNGARFTLLDAWREAYGCGGITIYAPDGRVVLRDAGSVTTRYDHLRRARAVNMAARQRLRYGRRPEL